MGTTDAARQSETGSSLKQGKRFTVKEAVGPEAISSSKLLIKDHKNPASQESCQPGWQRWPRTSHRLSQVWSLGDQTNHR